MSPEPRTSNLEPRTPERRLLACWWSIVRSGAITEARAYQVASEAVGRTLQPGFGLSTLMKVELIRVVDALKRAVGQSAGSHRSGPRAIENRQSEIANPKVVRIASLQQLQLLRALTEELRLSMEECAGIFRQACRAAHPRTAGQVGKCIEALKAIRSRRLRSAERRANSAVSGLGTRS